MNTQRITRYETKRIAEDACYVYTEDHNTVHKSALTYSRVHRRMFERIADDMMRSRVTHEGRLFELLGTAWGSLASVVHQMNWLAWLVATNENDAFKFGRREDGKLIRVEEMALGRYYALLYVLVRAVFDDELALDRFILTPYAEVFRDVVKYYADKVPVLLDCFAKLPIFFNTDVQRFCGEIANELFTLIRREAKLRCVDDEISARKAIGEHRMQRMTSFRDQCLSSCPVLKVITLECAFRPTGQAGDWVPLTIDNAKQYHSVFVNRLRGRAKFRDIAVGGIWSLAWGEHKGHHFRWIFMLDTFQVSESAYAVNLIKDIWTRVVPDNQGLVHFREEYNVCSVGYAESFAEEHVEMEVLDDELRFHALKDLYIQHNDAEGVRAWGTCVPAYARKSRQDR